MNSSFSFSQGNRSQIDNFYKGSPTVKDEYDFTISADHYSQLLLDSKDAVLTGQNPMNSTTKVPIQMNGIYRIGMQGVAVNFDIPNVNTYNNTISTLDVAIPKTCVLPIGFYPTRAALATAFQTAMQALGGGFAAMTVAIDATTQQIVFTNATAFTLIGTRQTELCMGIRNGSNAATGAGPFVYTGLVPSLIYSRYFDIHSTALTKYQRGDYTSSSASSKLLFRFFYPRTPGDQMGTPTFYGFDANGVKWMRYAPTADLGNIDILINDEFNQQAYYDATKMQFSYVITLYVRNFPNE